MASPANTRDHRRPRGSSGSRGRLTDFLQDCYFWAFDATAELALPVFNPLFGFSRISSPSISAEVESFKDGTFLYQRQVVKGGEVGSVMFERAASMFDADFYDWIIFAIHGDKGFESGGTLGKKLSFLSAATPQSFRRTILIVQFNRINLGTSSGADTSARIAGGLTTAVAGGVWGHALGLGAGQSAAISGMVTAGIGPFKFATRLPARAWILHGCIPINYRAASDFDATSGQVSLQELEVQPEYVEELSLGLKP